MILRSEQTRRGIDPALQQGFQKAEKSLNRNNNFFFAGEISSQLHCPFAAHVRKTNPRDDLEVPPPPIPPIAIEKRRIMRRGVQFGPEVTREEAHTGKTLHGRGLLFACYQTSIVNGFQFLQQCKLFSVATESCIDLVPYSLGQHRKFPSIHRQARAPRVRIIVCSHQIPKDLRVD